jgi:hypothetical protein
MWQEGINNWLSGMPEEKYHPPTDYCGSSSQINVEFERPKDKDSNLPNKFNVKMRANSTSDIENVEFFVDGDSVISFSGPPYEREVDLSKGVHKLRAKAKDKNGNESDREITIGIGVDWDYTPKPTSTVTPSPTITVAPSPT